MLVENSGTLSAKFKQILNISSVRGKFFEYDIDQSSYDPSNEDPDIRAQISEMIRRNLNPLNLLSGAVIEGSLRVYETETPRGIIYDAEMRLRRLYADHRIVQKYLKQGDTPPDISWELISQIALAPNRQQIRSIRFTGFFIEVDAIDMEGAHWVHRLIRDLKNQPLKDLTTS